MNEPEDPYGGVRRPRPTFRTLPQREHLSRLTNVFAKNPIYFLTCCTFERRSLLANGDSSRMLETAFRASPRYHSWTIGRYVIMPDHVHFFARPSPDAKILAAFVRDWKKWTATHLGLSAAQSGRTWQREFFDHVLRSENSYAEKWDYVRQNPVRAGLVERAEEWPYSGEIETLSF